MKKLLVLILISALISCTSSQTKETTEPETYQESAATELKIGDPATAILHVIALNPGKGKGHAFVMNLTAMDTANAGKLVRQLKYMNEQGSHGAPYPSTLYPHDSIFINKQGKICELWVASDNVTKDWVQLVCDTGYSEHTHIMENDRGRKMIFKNK